MEQNPTVPFERPVKGKTSRRSKNWSTLESNQLRAALRSVETRVQIAEDQLAKAREVIRTALGGTDAGIS